MRVLLIRHGRSAHGPPGGLLDRAGVERWRAAYDEAGTANDDRPPVGLATEVARASVIATSDLPRAAASAAHLARGRAVTASPLFREVPLPIPAWLPFRAPFTVWEALIHLRWGVDLFRGRSAAPEALERARAAAGWCREVCRQAAGDGGTVAVVTHGVFRYLLARQLLAEAWSAEPRRRSYAPWSVWRLDSGHDLDTSESAGQRGAAAGPSVARTP